MNWKNKLSRFSLRFFLVVIAALCVWLGFITSRAQNQKQMVEEIRKIGGTVYYDYQMQGSTPDQKQESAVFDWLIQRTGIDMFHTVIYVDLRKSDTLNQFQPTSVTGLSGIGRSTSRRIAQRRNDPLIDNLVVEGVVDAAKRFLDGGNVIGELADKCPRLESLKVSRRFAGDQAAFKIGRFKHLKRLMFERSSRLTDEGVEHIAKCKQLEVLLLNGQSELTDRSLEKISQLTKLERLALRSPKITDQGVSHLAKLQRLNSLRLYQPNMLDDDKSSLTDKSLESLAGLKDLNELIIGMEKFSSNGLSQLANLSSLEQLQITGNPNHENKINKETWDALADLPLKTVSVQPLIVDEKEVISIRKKNPACVINGR